MKKIIFFLIAALMVCGSADARKSKSSSKRKTSTALTVTKGETKDYYDYLKTQIFKLRKGEGNELTIEYPISGKGMLVNTIRTNIAFDLDDTYTGSLDNPEALMKAVMKNKKNPTFGMDGESLDEEIKVAYANPRIITYELRGDIYMGGAHGSHFDIGVTYLVENVDVFNVGMLPPIQKMRPYILKGLAKYFDTNVAGLGDILMGDPNDIDYPEYVFITDKGINFVYGEYEIGPYAIGLPRAIVPATDEIINMLTPEGQKFFR